uniref:Uncharacterized protein n=1 Tax=Arundo donax TaxID=35708 RepID=A0A0A9GGE2_ARUDO
MLSWSVTTRRGLLLLARGEERRRALLPSRLL